MSTSFTYTTLKTALKNWVEDNGTEFDTELDVIIGLGELRVVRELDSEIFNQKKNITITGSSQTIDKPSDMVAVKTITYTNSSNEIVILERRTFEYMDKYWPNALSTDAPKYFCELNDTQWRVVPTPNNTYSGVARGAVRPTQLSSSNATNWLSQNVGDLLFYACLLEAEIYLKEDIVADSGRVAGLQAKYNSLLGPAKFELNRMENADYSPIRSTPKA